MPANEKIKKYLESELYKEIKSDLMDQLERNGTVGKYYDDLANDYMDMWVTKCLLVDDIQKRGVNIKYNNGGGQLGYRKNDSVDQRMKVNAQMLKLLNELGIKPSKMDSDTDDDEEM
ncbi:P27 family phage terminase small subunit [Clostridium sp. BSD9I1]|uniref:P27 family phage terminase small subunit n=1 Tax=Clostridium sp. BSD9I1 TaxID=2003589 RepID=UPI001FA91056|nr:P27 family phage terminase small subunit [Clostridium sp. BSD9I1]